MNLMGDGSTGSQGSNTGTGSNQYASYMNPYGSPQTSTPGNSNFNTPYGQGGFSPESGGSYQTNMFGVQTGTSQGSPNWFGNPTQGYGGFYPGGTISSAPGISNVGSGYMSGSTYDPAMTGDFFSYLQSQIGQQGQMYPGQLTAAPNQLYGGLENFLSGQGSSIPGMNQLGTLAQTGGNINPASTAGYAGLEQMASTGDPTDVGPEWNAMVQAMQQNTQQGAAQLKESMAAGGNLVGTPYGTTMQDYYSNIGSQQQALLGQLQAQASEAAAGREMGAQEALTQYGMQGQEQTAANELAAAGQIGGMAGQTAQQLQGINQLGLTNAYQSWLQAQPQYSPLLPYMEASATTFPSYLTKGASSSPFSALAGAAGSVLGGALAGGYV